MYYRSNDKRRLGKTIIFFKVTPHTELYAYLQYCWRAHRIEYEIQFTTGYNTGLYINTYRLPTI